MTHKIGNFYERAAGQYAGQLHILAQVGEMMAALISLTDGEIWQWGVLVNSLDDISEAEFKRICSDQEFTHIESVKITY